MVHAPWVVQWIAVVLETLPAPTDSEANIVHSLAWPGVTLILVFRFRRYLKIFLNAIADRLPHDHLKFGPFELTPHSQVVPLDPDDADEATDTYAPDDIERIEKFFEFIADSPGYDKLQKWVAGEISPDLEVHDFLIDPQYASERSLAFEDLVKG